MYTIERLQNLTEYSDIDSVDRILAEYFLANLNNLSHLTLKKCIQETGVSKASIHRFYSHGGFNNFKSLLTVLSREVSDGYSYSSNYDSNIEFNSNQLKYLCNCLIKAKQIMFYGKQDEIDYFNHLKYLLVRAGITVLSLNLWDMEMVNNRIDRLNDNDVLIVVDSTLRIQNMFEMTMTRSYLLNFERLKNAKFHCFYLGSSNCDQYFGFKNIKIKNDNRIEISLLVDEMIKRLKKKGF